MLDKQDSAQVEALYREYGGLVYRRCLRILRDSDAALTAVQEVFMRFIIRLEQKPEINFARAYLFRTATNICLNTLRDRKPVTELVEEEYAGSAGTDPGVLAEQRLMLAHGLSSLKDDERLALWLHLAEGLTQAEVAEVLGTSRKTVNEMLGRVRASLAGPASAEEAEDD
jgi:RNA polymerase sigma-70 factor, ECF subfamily